MTEAKPPLPPFTHETAIEKVQAAEDAWNTREPAKVAQAYTVDSVWRNRDQFVNGRDEIIEFLTQKWERELDYALRKNLWCYAENRIAVRFQYESRDRAGQWWRSYGNELWEFDEHGLMRRREASINDLQIDESERRIFAPRPEAERGHEFPSPLGASQQHHGPMWPVKARRVRTRRRPATRRARQPASARRRRTNVQLRPRPEQRHARAIPPHVAGASS